MADKYRIHIDAGGTFTDCIGLTPEGETIYRKVLSSGCLRGEIERWISGKECIIRESWEVPAELILGFRLTLPSYPGKEYLVAAYDPGKRVLRTDHDIPSDHRKEKLIFELSTGEEAPVLGIRLITGTSPGVSFPPVEIRLGTTKGTNALLEMRGSETILVTTSGFGDILHIGNQQRPDIFARKIVKQPPLTSGIIEVPERIDSHGEMLHPIESEALEEELGGLEHKEGGSIAISFLNAYMNPRHERKAAEIAEKLGFAHISVSSELSSMIKFLDRTETTVVNAYLSPVVQSYLQNITRQVGAENLRVMTSAGGLAKASLFKPMQSLLSGPAGGVVGAVIKGRQLGDDHLITFDMGGTSTDVSRYDGEFDYVFDLQVGSAHIMSPALAIETVAAGGGSVCGYDGYRLFVGPESAGARPGPACYGGGGPLTLTDINLLAGRLHPDNFSIPIYPGAAEEELEKLADAISKSAGSRPSLMELVSGFTAIANEIMAGAIKKISVLKGYNPVQYTLVSFGGAGGLHACGIASQLGIRKIILPEEAGLLSAFGIGCARVERFAEKQLLASYQDCKGNLDEEMKALELEALSRLGEEGVGPEGVVVRSRKVFCRYRGQDRSIELEYSEAMELEAQFSDKYREVYGHTIHNRILEVEALRVVVSDVGSVHEASSGMEADSKPEPHAFTSSDHPVYKTDQILPGHRIEGPALLLDRFSTTFVETGWQYVMYSDRTGVLTARPGIKADATVQRPFEAELELFTNRFMSIAEHMGAMLQRTAFSVNIKERLDFSCALLDAEGNLVANAPHIPVHLGGLGICVKELIRRIPFRPGDTMVTNHPGFGGSHLPDITTVTPVFDPDGPLIGFVVNRAHHSEIGGISPGSMPPSARNLAEEGVVIAPFLLVREQVANWDGMYRILTASPYPTRNPEENMADLNAALAANKKGTDALLKLVEIHGTGEVRFYFDALRKHAADRMALTLDRIPDGDYAATEYLDDGSALSVKIKKTGEYCLIDFSGSAPVQSSNMNATRAIVHSVVIYVLRLLLDEPIPLNDGLLEPVDIVVPPGMLNPDFPEDPFKCPAVVGGNVEISQRLTDTLLKAFGTMAASQGTMNNVLFGNDRFGYYETLAGGTGAGNGFAGSDAVHHHMTNTRITDPEVIEHRYPVRIVENRIRRGSGGNGKWKGGNGLTRIYEFRERVNLSLLTQRRQSRPYGMDGGGPGKSGGQYILKQDGSRIELKHIDNMDLGPGDRLVIHTPGGGGFGPEYPSKPQSS